MRLHSLLRVMVRRLLLVVAAAAVLAAGVYFANRRAPVSPAEIYQGIVYGCDRLEPDAEGSGLVHWVRVDLTAPGIELFVTSLDAEAVSQGWQFRLRKTGTVLQNERLAVAINGTLFDSDSGWLRLTGDLAKGVETTVANHHVSHVWEHTYLLWFADDLTPQIERSAPPGQDVLDEARWGIGGQALWLVDGKLREGTERKPIDSRTAVGINPREKLLFLAVFESASPRRALEKLAKLGAADAMLLDGGDSTSMALGEQVRESGIRPGVVIGDWRPVATHFGVRAKPRAKK